jgi:hypothetical protein
MISGFRGATGTAGVVFIALAALAWLALPLAHPVYAAVIPPLIAAGAVFAAIRLRRGPRHPSIREDSRKLVSPGPTIEPK